MIRLEGINKDIITKNETLNILKDINLVVNEGDFVVVMGKSGSGKSTLLNIIGGIEKPTTGSYYFRDKLIKSNTDQQVLRLKSIGFVVQNYALINDISVLDNIKLACNDKVDHRLLDDIVKLLDIKKLLHTKTLLLSGGEKQRVAIARAIIKKPSLILADEPTGAVDSTNALYIMELLKKLNDDGMTIILVTHDQDVSKYGNRIIQLSNGIMK